MKVLFALESKNDMRKNIVSHINKLGYEVICFPKENFKPYELNFLDKVLNILFLTIKRKNFILRKRKIRHDKKYKNAQISHIKSQDFYKYSIIFRADSIEDEVLKLIREKSEKMIAYQWDGMKRYPEIDTKIKFFDSFFCFDPKDADDQNIKFISNFYFDKLPIKSQTNEYDLTYIGYYYPDRFRLLENLAETLKGVHINFQLKSFRLNEVNEIKHSKYIEYIEQVFNYEELLEIHSKSLAILDLKHPVHDGLSFRFFEAMILEKKLITTNEEVKNYDFYNSQNIFILNEKNVNQIKDFLMQPYHSLDPKIVEKYSFSNWFKNLTDSTDKIPIFNPIQDA